MPSWLNRELHPRDGDTVVFNNRIGKLNARLNDPKSRCSITVDGKEMIEMLFGQFKRIFFYDLETSTWRPILNDWDYYVQEKFPALSIDYYE